MEKGEFEKIKIDYDNTVAYIFHLSDIRFKLLGMLPIATGITFALTNTTESINSLVLGVLGLLVTIGILFYDQRNTEIYDGLIGKARRLERKMKIEKSQMSECYGGTFKNRSERGRKFLGIFQMWHDKALAIIYATVIWVWLFIIISSCIKIFEIQMGILYWFLISLSILIPIIVYLNLIYLDKKNRKPDIESITIIIYVSNQEKSSDFYRNLLDNDPSLDVPGMTEFIIKDKVKLGIMPEQGIAKIICPTLPHPKEANGIPRCEIYLRVADPTLYMKRALKMGGKEISSLQNRDWGDEVAYVSDLDGHVIAFAKEILS